ncbi:MAG: histidine kinase [Fulvivirga sp.]|nr:histidine kinase [Fulvivirga sp.]
MYKRKLYWTLQCGGWLSFALLQIAAYLIFGGQTIVFNQIIFLLFEAFLFLTFTHLFRTLIIKWGWLALSMARLIPRVLLSVFVLGFIIYFARLAASIPLGVYDPSVALSLSNIIGLSLIYSLILFLWAVLYFIYHYFEQYNLSLKHEAAIHEIELNNLKSQLNPHFIFNALNSIRALVDENPVKSKNSITQLSNILRSSLVSDKKRLIKFENELRTVKDYLGLESIRFEERLQTKFDLDPEGFRFYVPPLMLQTLVENGVKHGISKLKQGGMIELKTHVRGDKLTIEIKNSGHFKELNSHANNEKGGLGLKNTRKRLNLLYGEDASFQIYNDSDHSVVTKLIIPKSNTK